MRDPHSDLAGLAQLHRVASDEQIRALWRRGMATLAAMASEHRPVPLEGFNPSALLSMARIALRRGLVDDLGWLSPPAAAVAIYELAAALPRGEEKRELGRRVLGNLHQGDAETFVALATALALGSSRILRGPQVRARVALSLDLPIGMGLRADPLALALISRRESEREWLGQPSTGALPSRRLAARLLERAAREAARRAAAGDHTGVRVLQLPTVRASLARLLGDRESLVWRHAAAARGLLSAALPALADDIERDLAPDLSPTEWRRAAASLAARIAVAPEATLGRCRTLLAGPVVARDHGVVAAMILGLPCAADAELDAAETLLDALVDAGDLQAMEALVDLRRERIGSRFGARAAQRARAALAGALPGGRAYAPGHGDDEDRGALREALIRDLAVPGERSERTLQDCLAAALEAFAAGGDAGAAAEQALEAAHDALIRLEHAAGDPGTGLGPARSDVDQRAAFSALRELDRGLLETSTLGDLLVIRAPGSRAAVEHLMGRLARWLLAREARPIRPDELELVSRRIHWRMRRLRALLHLVDADSLTDAQGLHDDDRREEAREWRLRALDVLLTRARHDAPSPLRRAVCAALARACDAVVREDMGELSDVLVAVLMSVPGDSELAVLAEASMDPGFESTMRAYVEALRAVSMALEDAPGLLQPCLEALEALTAAMPATASPRVEALHGALLRVTRALQALGAASSLEEVCGDGAQVEELTASVTWLARLAAGASRRLGQGQSGDRSESSLAAALRAVEAGLERAMRGDRDGLGASLRAAVRAMREQLPPVVADVAALVLEHLSRLPAAVSASEPAATQAAAPVASWLPPNRVLGGFYILRTIGRGAVGSVFVACRVDQRNDPQARRMALKVPEYGGDAAHTLSEAEFMHLFREEAQALLALPEHPNLARFVTFDAGVRPKPILVMELVEGPTLERVLEREEMSVAENLAILDGIAAGLDAMHGVGVAHLDVKPSNIILRERAGAEPMAEQHGILPVLVDFGLAGRHIRPGCATVYYGAPEVWESEARLDLAPMPTDVYAFCCLAFEMLTGELLFDGETAVSIVSRHMEHDGWPEQLYAFGRRAHLAPLMELLSAGLRARGEDRASIASIRAGLAQLAPALAGRPWPLR